MALTDQIRDQLRKDIRAGIYPPGSKLPTRAALMKTYRIARGSVDKVIRQLVQEGLLTSSQGAGTYVLDWRSSEPHLYVVLNTDAECPEVVNFHATLPLMLTKITNSKHTMVGSGDLDRVLPEILANSHSKVIWSRPSITCYGAIAALKRANIQQILVNRPLPAYNFVSTDTEQALNMAFENIDTQCPNARLGLIAPPINLEEPFLAEREIYFQEKVHQYRFALTFMGRTADKSTEQILAVARRALAQVDTIDYLFVPDYYMVPCVITLAAERGIQLGPELKLVTIDWNEDRRVQGILCLRQRWDLMFEAALRWATSEPPAPIHTFIPPELQESTT